MTHIHIDSLADRARLARELHDGIAQDLVGVGYSLDILLANPETSIASRSQLRSLRFTVTDLIDKVRREIYFLRQPSAFPLGQTIGSAAEILCQGLELNLDIEELDANDDSERSHEIYQVAQEILRNIVLHAKASKVTVSFRSSREMIDLCITDNGIGGAAISDSHFGMLNIQERTDLLQGLLECTSDSGGTRVYLRIPNGNYANR
jgi:NarL family two-component system sensor histidine kinase LiaS